MASRENQGLQVALILFVMVTVVLAVTTYVYFRKSEEKINQKATAEREMQRAQQMSTAILLENQLLKHVLGLEPKPENMAATQDMEKIWASYERDMAKYGAGLPPDSLNYRNLPEPLVDTIRTLNSDITAANVQVKELTAAREKIRKDEQARATTAIAAMDAAMTKYIGERRQFVTAKADIEASKNQIATQLSERGQELDRMAGKMVEERESRDMIIAQMQEQLDAMRAKERAEQETTFETPDGKITWVNQRSRVVWIDLGSADGLQRQMTFSVYDREETGVTSGKVKGRVEVTSVMGPHLAEARIIEDVVTDPILPEDTVFSPSFKRGQKTRYALVGLLDINGDGKSDQAKVKSIITMNGGVVDAELLEDGVIAGKMSLETKYLVKGERPKDRSNQELQDGYSRMIEEATRLGVEPLSLNLLLDRLNYHEDQRTAPPSGSGGSGSGAGPRKPSTFRPRTAPRSAY
jgi:hypothetical protein